MDCASQRRCILLLHDLTVTASLPCTLPMAHGQQNTGKRCHPGLFLLTSHHRQLPTMSNTPPPPITTYWTTADRAFFIGCVKAGCINNNDTTPAAIAATQNKYWVHKSLCSFCTNYRKVASDLQVERHVHRGRGTRMSFVLLHDHTPLSLIFPLSWDSSRSRRHHLQPQQRGCRRRRRRHRQRRRGQQRRGHRRY